MIIYMAQTINLIIEEKGLETAQNIVNKCNVFQLPSGTPYFILNENEDEPF